MVLLNVNKITYSTEKYISAVITITIHFIIVLMFLSFLSSSTCNVIHFQHSIALLVITYRIKLKSQLPLLNIHRIE